MREFIVENLTNTEALSVTVILMNNIIALIVSFFIMFIYKISYVGTAYSRKFNISIGTITIITAMIMSIISNNIALSLGMVGALSIIRFRTAVKDIPQHSMTALVGKSGCGKSTIVNLIARFWDTDSGTVSIGGTDIKAMTTESLLENISVVFQNVYLFNDTIFNNIAFGKKGATKEEVIEACKKARCHEFISALENSYDTVIGEGGSTLSGGEKQRISIARAILKDAPIVLLDEATASIDPDNEAYIQQAINEMVKGKTLVVIAHKLSAIMEADQILMIEDGQITARGTHSQLLHSSSAYHELWKKQNF